MRSLWFTATVAAAAFVLCGCPYHKQQPVPGPQSGSGGAPGHPGAALGRLSHGVHREHAPDPINWFQGTLDEAFSGRACTEELGPRLHARP
jgi:hypothetical protein